MDAPILPGYRYMTRVPEILGGKTIIKGTRIAVKTIVGYYRLGMSPEEILESLPHITPAQLFEALSYYHDNVEEINRDLEAEAVAYRRLKAENPR